jgi:hypothetical protein
MSNRSNQKNLLIILYGRILSLFQEVANFARRGRLSATRQLLRDLIDTLAAIAAVAKDPSLASHFIKQDDVPQLFRGKKHRPLPRDLDGVIAALTGRRLAKRAGMLEYYDALMKSLIAPSYLYLAEPGPVVVVPWETLAEPTLLGLPDVLNPACESLFLASRIVADSFGIQGLDRQYYELFATYSTLARSS